MSEGQVDPVSVQLGEIRATLKQFMENWRVQDQRAVDSRNEMHHAINDLRLGAGGMMRDIAATRHDIAEMRPKVERAIGLAAAVDKMAPELEQLKALSDQAKGAGWVLNTLRAVFVSLVAAAAWLAARLYPSQVTH